MRSQTARYGTCVIISHSILILRFDSQALDGALKQVKTLSPETSAIFFSVDTEANKIVVLAAAPKVI